MKGSSVLFNEAGRSIESSCLVYKKKTWARYYVLCSQPNDISVVVLYIYKSYKQRLKNNETSAIPLGTFVGMETGFELKKQNNTMCVITKTDILIVSFRTAEILTMWETWLSHTCSKGSLFYVQLVGAPETSRAYGLLNCEVRLHIHDGRIALVSCYPQRLIGFWFLSDIIRVGFTENKIQFFANDKSGLDGGVYTLVSGQIQLLEKYYKLANKPGLLIDFLKQKEGDGLWYEDKSSDSSKSVVRHSSIQSGHSPERNQSGLLGILRSSSNKLKTPEVNHNDMDGLSAVPVSNSQVAPSAFYVNVPADPKYHPPISNASSMASCCVPYANDMVEQCLHSRSEPSVSSVGQWDKSADVLLNLSSKDRSNLVLSSTATSSKSLLRADSWPKPLTDEIIRRREMFARTRKWSAINGRETKGRFVKQERKSGFRGKLYNGSFNGERSGFVVDDILQKNRLPKRSRSLGMESRYLSASREENWNRAKRIIGGVRKSINDLNACKFSTSLDKLAISPMGSHAETMSVTLPSVNENVQVSGRTAVDGSQELDSTAQGSKNFVSPLSVQPVNRLPGLIKLPPKKFGLKRARHILTKSLQKSISGSFSKYDGERSVNHFHLEDAKCNDPVVDCIESAVKKGRARLIEAERRNSEFGDTASPTNSSSQSVRTALLENLPVVCSTVAAPHTVEFPEVKCCREVSKNDETLVFDECYDAVKTLSLAAGWQSPRKNDNLSMTSVKTYFHVPPTELLSRTGSLKVGFNPAAKETYTETAQLTPTSKPSIASLSGSYCNLETRSKNSFQRLSGISRTVYVQIDPVATLGATQTQQTMMRDRARVGNLMKNKRCSSQNNVESKDRRCSEEGNNPNKGSFARRLWRKFPGSMSHSDLRF